MRKIKFRGKRVDAGEWVYGDLAYNYDSYIKDNQNLIGDLYRGWIKVDPTTVGQYTGLKDKNGVEIYEGDVLLWGDDNRQNQVVFSQGSFQMQRYGGLAPLRYHNLINSEAMNAEVIGNIHDNPDLLTGGKE